jgi:hypothetical protein
VVSGTGGNRVAVGGIGVSVGGFGVDDGGIGVEAGGIAVGNVGLSGSEELEHEVPNTTKMKLDNTIKDLATDECIIISKWRVR